MAADLISGGVATFFGFGYLGYLWTHSFTWVLAVILSAYTLTVAFSLAQHSIFDVFLELPAAAELGIFLGWLVVNASLLPPLVPRLAYYMVTTVVRRTAADRDLDGGLRVDVYGAQSSAIGGPVFVLGGAYTLAGVYDDNITFAEKLLYGIPLLVVGVAFTIYGFYVLFASPLRADRADGRYILYLFVLALGPSLIYIAAVPLGAADILFFIVALGVITTVIICIELRLLAGGPAVVPLEDDPRYLRRERYPFRVVLRWMITTLPILVVFIVTWGVESFIDDVSTGDSLAAAGGTVVFMAIITLFFGGASSPARATGSYADAPPDGEAADEAATQRDAYTVVTPTQTAVAVNQRKHVSFAAATKKDDGDAKRSRPSMGSLGVDLRPYDERSD